MGKLLGWVDARLPVVNAFEKHLSKYYAPRNLNFWYYFGSLSMLILVIQIVTGIWLAMDYVPTAAEAFSSVQYIMRDVQYGWLLRYVHSTGGSAFFIVVYLHMFRGLMYGSHRKPRELIWLFGMGIFGVLMAEVFTGYLLPWGQMSYWGAQVIVNLFGAIPVIGHDLTVWVRGDYLVSGVTLNRFYALHVVALPLILLGLTVLHLLALHEVGSNNPDGVEIKKHKDANGIPKDGVAFHPYYTVHDLVAVVVFLFVFLGIVFFMPEMGGYFLEQKNFVPANPLVTPSHIAPLWYFTPFYAMLRAVTFSLFGLSAKFWGVVIMGAGVAILFVLPWIDRSPVKSIRYKGWITKLALLLFVISFVTLSYLGLKPPSPLNRLVSQVMTVVYFAYFILMPWWSKIDKTKPVPERVTGK